MLTKFDFQPFDTNNLIRRGAKNDGGYLIPEDAKADLLISFGLGDDWKFELDLVRNNHVNKFIVFDHTQNLLVYAIRLLKRINVNNFKFSAFIYRLLILLRYLRDYVIRNNIHIKKRITKQGSVIINNNVKKLVNDINLYELFDKFVSSPNIRVILKIDIEGSEYEIIQQILHHSDQVILLVIEFHDITDNMLIFEQCLSLLKMKYSLIHSHINNYGHVDENLIPQICEFTFIHKAHFHENRKVDKLPREGLDSPTTPFRPDFQISFL
jgi:hypothetical protein